MSSTSAAASLQDEATWFAAAWPASDVQRAQGLCDRLRAASIEQKHTTDLRLYLMINKKECSHVRIMGEDAQMSDETKRGSLTELMGLIVKQGFVLNCCACAKLLSGGTYQTGAIRIINNYVFAVLVCLGNPVCALNAEMRLALIFSSEPNPLTAIQPATPPTT